MKTLFRSLMIGFVLITLLVPAVQSQTLSYSPSTPLENMVFRIDSTQWSATDSSTQFYTPVRIRLAGVHVFCSTSDTGAASPSSTFTIHQGATGSAAIATVTLLTTAKYNTSYDNTTTFPVSMAAGKRWHIKSVNGTSDQAKNVTVILWYYRY